MRRPKLRDFWRDRKIRALMRMPGVMDSYDGFMHAFHNLPVEGCISSKHSGRAYEEGFRRGLADPGKAASDEAARRRREWKPPEDEEDERIKPAKEAGQ